MGRGDIQLEKDLVDGARIATVPAGCALVKGQNVGIALRWPARPWCSRASGIGLLEERRDITRTGDLLRELLMREDEKGWTAEDGESYEAMMDLSHRRTSDLYG